ncbi:hypothetical protein G6549_22020 [Bacillus sp. MM2020_1]|nr:hypothetical protein [Bacillus sp. MM2020_1]
MNNLKNIDSNKAVWEKISDGVEQLVLRLEPSEGRFLVRFAPGKGYPKHRHPDVEEVFVLEGTYLDMGRSIGLVHTYIILQIVYMLPLVQLDVRL